MLFLGLRIYFSSSKGSSFPSKTSDSIYSTVLFAEMGALVFSELDCLQSWENIEVATENKLFGEGMYRNN